MKNILIIGALLTILNQTWASEETLRLENPRIAVEIDQQSGAIQSIRDKEQDITYPFSGIGFSVITETGVIRAKNVVETKTSNDGVEMHFTEGRLNITLHYRLGTNDRFIEK